MKVLSRRRKTALVVISTTITAILTSSPHAQSEVQLSSEKAQYYMGERIFFVLRNLGPESLVLPYTEPWEIRDAHDDRIVYARPASGRKRTLKPNEPVSWSWDQLSQARKQAPPGSYRILVYTSKGPLPPAQFDILPTFEGSKKAARIATHASNLLGTEFSVFGSISPVSVPMLLAEAACFVLSLASLAYAEDPFDPKFSEFAQIRQSKITTPPARSELDDAANRFTIETVRIADIISAMTVTANRLQSGKTANDTGAVKSQAGQLSKLAAQLEKQLAEYPALAKRLADSLSKTDRPTSITAQSFSAFQQQLRSAGLPGEEIRLLKEAGLTEEDIRTITLRLSEIRPQPYDLPRLHLDFIKAINEVKASSHALARFGP